MNRGFISIPILIAIIFGTVLVGGGSYLVTKEISSTDPIETPVNNDSADVHVASTNSTQEEVEIASDETAQSQTVVSEPTVEKQNVPTQLTEEVGRKYSFDLETRNICADVEDKEISTTNSLLGVINLLCQQAENNLYEDEDGFIEVVNRIHEKWGLWLTAESANKKNDDADEEPTVSYSDSQCVSQKESLLSQVDSVYLNWYEDWQDARTELDSCYNSNSVPYCDKKMTDVNVQWQEKITNTMETYQTKLTQCAPEDRIFSDISDVVSAPY